MASLPAAFFLACSWFWCIGGFFPVLLERDFGQIALPFFIVFNVAGAALFGFVWGPAARERFLARHRLPAQFFSVLVVGYHVVFVFWISVLLSDSLPLIAFLGLVAAFAMARRHLVSAAPAVFAVTAVLFAVAVAAPPPAAVAAPPVQPFGHQILPLALGFLLAPCFDLTFHRVFAESERPRTVFLLGFGVLFAALLGGMVVAAPVFAQIMTSPALAGPGLHAVVAILVLQTAFTTAAHLREIGGTRWFDAGFALPAIGAVAILCGLHLVVGLAAPGMEFAAGELVYRGFVFLIGVLFPVILLFEGVNRMSVAAMVLLTPCYTLGFLVGGGYAPFLSVAVAGLAALYWLRPRPVARELQ